ncbi:hypothetical protein BACOVA_02695 [Bacteroides ovatus ATCC 8483]|uniref:Uncharacterized protein n=1 Tax=Bacteroides ovatus (strain ATCC 8483 / DSM 1896 / JCM 5824 / BCRC 10623 / CCUG 4943 / NCTC 11153) TaxID=411476 RepID=A0AAN3A7S1_BACO1|nr:hypothetical protein BACOVA_02695 [Bacteroides ovatus ATCC 8483]
MVFCDKPLRSVIVLIFNISKANALLQNNKKNKTGYICRMCFRFKDATNIKD